MYLFPLLYLDLYVLRFCRCQTSNAVMQAIVNVNVTREAKLFFAFETLTQHTSRRVHDDATAIALSEKKTIVFTVANLLSLLRFLVRNRLFSPRRTASLGTSDDNFSPSAAKTPTITDTSRTDWATRPLSLRISDTDTLHSSVQ